MDGEKQPGNPLSVKMRMGILHTIAESIYSGLNGRIREAVANSIDNKASNFIIYLDRTTRTVSLFDDGNGISREKFNDIFNNLGLGLDRNKIDAVSYFGLGLMSVIRLGNQASIITKPSKTDEM
ncbi:MAG: ATP-binding protein [Nitrospirota bacterium]